jgi:hypothetical protein
MLFTALLAATLSLSPSSPAAPSCISPTQTGTYRFTALSKDSTSSKIGMIVLENIEGCLEATLLTDDAGPAIIDHLALQENVLSGNIRVSGGNAKVTLTLSSNGMIGSIADGKKEWKLAGRRTSGSALDVAVR